MSSRCMLVRNVRFSLVWVPCGIERRRSGPEGVGDCLNYEKICREGPEGVRHVLLDKARSRTNFCFIW